MLQLKQKFQLRPIRFFSTYSQEYLLEAQTLIAAEFGVYLTLEEPLQSLLFMSSSAKERREKRVKAAEKPTRPQRRR